MALGNRLAATGGRFGTYRRGPHAQEAISQQAKPSEPSLSSKLVRSASNAALRRAASHRGQTGTATNIITRNISTASFSQRSEKRRSARKPGIPVLRCSTNTAGANHKPGSGSRHDRGGLPLSPPQTPEDSHGLSPVTAPERPVTSGSCIGRSMTRGRLGLADDAARCCQEKALPLTPSREGIDVSVPRSLPTSTGHGNSTTGPRAESSIPRATSAGSGTGRSRSGLSPSADAPGLLLAGPRPARSVSHQGRLSRRGPAAGTGHEGYGKFAPTATRRKSTIRRKRTTLQQNSTRLAIDSASQQQQQQQRSKLDVPEMKQPSARPDRGEDAIAAAATTASATTSPADDSMAVTSAEHSGYCISPTPRLDLCPAARSETALHKIGAASDHLSVAAPASKKGWRPRKLNWTFIKT
ncbi:hypothetical protein KEM52_006601, partial [Ascosphaera acerosa]